MDGTLGIILLVLLALAIGMLAPVLFQARRTLAVAERRMDRLGQKLEDLVDDAHRVTRRVDRLTEDLEKAGVPAARLVESVADLAAGVERLRDRVSTVATVAATVGPAVVGFIRAWRGEAAAEPDDDGEARS